MDHLLQLNRVCKSYGSKLALNDVTLSVGRGKIIGLLGSNGSGKSTLLHLAAGLIQPTSGSVSLLGLSAGWKTRRNTAFMADRPMTEEWMKVRDMLFFYQDFYDDFDINKAREMINFMRVSGSSDVMGLSKGMKERLQISLTLSRNTSLYLLDEPVGGVDPATREKILDAIVQFYTEDSSLILATHLVHDLERIFDEVILIKDGEIFFTDDVENIRMKYGKSIDDLCKEVFSG